MRVPFAGFFGLAALLLAACGSARPESAAPLAAALADAADPEAWILLGHFDDGLGYGVTPEEHTFYIDDIFKLPQGREYQLKDYAIVTSASPPPFAVEQPVIGVFHLGPIGGRDVVMHLLPASPENLTAICRRFPRQDRLAVDPPEEP
jgi:hypothetical protein